jgi:hypothetical protein
MGLEVRGAMMNTPTPQQKDIPGGERMMILI